MVDVEVRLEAVGKGIASTSFSADLPSEPRVDERPLAPSLGGTKDIDGVDAPERVDNVDSLRMIEGPGDPNGAFVRAVTECVGEGIGDLDSPFPASNRIVVDFLSGDMDFRPLIECLGVVPDVLARADAGATNFSGSGNKGPLSFFRRFSRKNVVVVEMVWVVVVCA